METLFFIATIIFFLIGLILTYHSYKFFKTMWKYKNRKKDGSEDDDFKYFD